MFEIRTCKIRSSNQGTEKFNCNSYPKIVHVSNEKNNLAFSVMKKNGFKQKNTARKT